MAERHNLQLSSSRQRLSAEYLLAIVIGGWQLICEFFLLRQFRPARVFLGATLSETFDIHVSQRRPFFILYDTTLKPMNNSIVSKTPGSEASCCSDRLPEKRLVAAEGNIPGATFKCDACRETGPISQAITSRILSCSRFCSIDCCEEAELAAENAKHI